ncbi:unnamed protein product, partial [Scytosiphon promiscuus]
MADPRARAELDAIFPGVEEREFRALLEECIERSQTPPLYRKPADRNYRDGGGGGGGGDRHYSRMEAERMYHERERAYHRDHAPPHEPPPGYPGPERPMYRDVRDMGERFYSGPRQGYPAPNGAAYHDPRDHGYPRQRIGAASAVGAAPGAAYPEQRQGPLRAGGGGGYVHPKHELPEDIDKAYDADPETSYPKYPGRGRGRPGPGPEDGPPMRGGMPQHSPALSPQARNSGRPADVVVGPPPLYKAPARQGRAAGVSPSLPPLEGGAYHHHHRHHLHNRGGGGGGGGSHHSSPTGSPLAHGRRGSEDVPSPPLRGDMRPRGGSMSSLPAAAVAAAAVGRVGPPQSRAGVMTRGSGGGGGVGGSIEDDGSMKPHSEDEVGGRSSRHAVGGRQHAGGPRPEDSDEKPFCEVVRDESGVTRLFIPETPPVVPRRPPSKGNKRETLSDIAHRIPVTVMRPYFNYPLRTAAEAMNISVTTLKRLCRRHGVKRWPHRQISGINRAMAHLEFQQDQAGRRSNCEKTVSRNNQVSEQMQELLRRRKVMIEHAFESDDGGSRQHLKSSDSEDETADPDGFFETRRATKGEAGSNADVGGVGNGGGADRKRGHGGQQHHLAHDNDDDDAVVAPAYNPATADAAIRAVRGGRGRSIRSRSPDSSPSDK